MGVFEAHFLLKFFPIKKNVSSNKVLFTIISKNTQQQQQLNLERDKVRQYSDTTVNKRKYLDCAIQNGEVENFVFLKSMLIST